MVRTGPQPARVGPAVRLDPARAFLRDTAPDLAAALPAEADIARGLIASTDAARVDGRARGRFAWWDRRTGNGSRLCVFASSAPAAATLQRLLAVMTSVWPHSMWIPSGVSVGRSPADVARFLDLVSVIAASTPRFVLGDARNGSRIVTGGDFAHLRMLLAFEAEQVARNLARAQAGRALARQRTGNAATHAAPQGDR